MRHAMVWSCGLLLGMQMLPVHAEPVFARAYKNQYGYQPSCNACHTDGGGSPLNAYGKKFNNSGKHAGAFTTIERWDSDGDGAINGDEVKAKSNPGNRESTPKRPGNWLDTASLIPKEVQAQFPGVRSYLPKDATLTPDETERASKMGATLSAEDENTIFIPVGEDKKPLGTAIIAPGSYRGQAFFVLLATDAQLNVKTVAAVNTKKVPEAAKSRIYSSFNGKNLKDLPAGDANTVDGAVTEAVKKAGTLVYVRLKKE